MKKTKTTKIDVIENPVPKILTGIEGFDAISRGGLPKGRSTLVTGTSGSSKTILSLQYLYNGIKKYKEPGVFVTFEETVQDIKKNVKSFGWDLEKLQQEKMISFVDVSPDPFTDTFTAGNFDFSALLSRIEHAITSINAKRISIDSIGSLFAQFEDSKLVRRELFKLSAGLKQLNVTAMITSERVDEYGSIARYDVEEFVADNVIILRNILESERRRRTVEILKYRGSFHQKGEFPFTISNEGIEVLPLSAMELTQSSTNLRISTGNKKFDEMCGGGFFRDSIILVSGATGTGKTLTATTFVEEGSRRNEKTLIFAFEESREQLLRNAIGWNLDFRQWEKKGIMKIVCLYPEVLGLEDHLLSMKKIIEQFSPSRIAVDSLSALERVASVRSFREFVIGLTSFIKARQIAGLFTATTSSLMGGSSVTENHISTITDTIILLRYAEILGQMRRGATVLKMRGSIHDKFIREYTIDGEGMHIGEPFQNVGGILAGNPTHILGSEELKMSNMFNDVNNLQA